MSAPKLLTTRLELSAPQASDFEAFAATWADKEVVRFVGGQTRDRQDSWLTLMRNAGFWDLLGYGPWIRRGMDPDISGVPEAGWVFAQRHWGKGYATEALTATHAWLDQHHPGRSVCIIEPDHAAAIRVAQKLGYRDFESSDYKGEPMLIFERYSRET